jgi:hypothetical protein
MYYMQINNNFVHQVGDQPRSSSGCSARILIKYKQIWNILISKQLFMALKNVNNVNKLTMSVAFLTVRQVQLHCRVYLTFWYLVALEDLV